MAELTAQEKHTPVIRIIDNNTVEIIVPDHPAQTEAHYITNISLYSSDFQLLESKDFTHTDEAIATFTVESTENLQATENCNLHWTWNEKWENIS